MATLHVHCINGTKCEVRVNTAVTTVAALKLKLQQMSHISVERQQLLYNGKTMQPDSSSLKSHGLTDGENSVTLFDVLSDNREI